MKLTTDKRYSRSLLRLPRLHCLVACKRLLPGLLRSTVVALILFSPMAFAAKSDFTQPIDVKADRSEYNEKDGTQVLSGNVEIKQGSMIIRAQEIDVALKDNKLSVIKGKGNPIEFQQENEQGELVTGSCNSIVYDAVKGVLTLIGNASLSQPKQQLKSEKIVFNSISQTVIAEGGQSGQVSIQIQPPTQTQ